MKKYIGILIAAVVCFMMALAVQAEDAVVYVNDGGTGRRLQSNFAARQHE